MTSLRPRGIHVDDMESTDRDLEQAIVMNGGDERESRAFLLARSVHVVNRYLREHPCVFFCIVVSILVVCALSSLPVVRETVAIVDPDVPSGPWTFPKKGEYSRVSTRPVCSERKVVGLVGGVFEIGTTNRPKLRLLKPPRGVFASKFSFSDPFLLSAVHESGPVVETSVLLLSTDAESFVRFLPAPEECQSSVVDFRYFELTTVRTGPEMSRRPIVLLGFKNCGVFVFALDEMGNWLTRKLSHDADSAGDVWKSGEDIVSVELCGYTVGVLAKSKEFFSSYVFDMYVPSFFDSENRTTSSSFFVPSDEVRGVEAHLGICPVAPRTHGTNDCLTRIAVMTGTKLGAGGVYALRNALDHLPSEWKIWIFDHVVIDRGGNLIDRRNGVFFGGSERETLKNDPKIRDAVITKRISFHAVYLRVSNEWPRPDKFGGLEYNLLCLEPDYYAQVPADVMLVFQSDSALCSKSDVSITQFVDENVDYLGGAWPSQNSPMTIKDSAAHEKGGNGGFSLRMTGALQHAMSVCRLDRQARILDKSDTIWEDTLVTSCLFRVGYELNDRVLGLKFSVETQPYERPMAFHKCWDANCCGKMTDCPEADDVFSLWLDAGNEPKSGQAEKTCDGTD